MSAELPSPKSLRILVAEDNPVNVKLISLVLSALGYHADIAANGEEVLAALRRNTYDVVLMDIHMPQMDGIEATRCICREWTLRQRPRIVALTASAMPEERAAAFAAGADEFLTKPLDRSQLRQMLERCPVLVPVSLTEHLPIAETIPTVVVPPT